MNTTTAMQVEQDEYIEAVPERVWQVMASEDGIKQWLGPSVYEAREGAAVRFDVNHEGRQYVMSGEVTRCDPPRELAFTWREQEVGQTGWPVPTLVTLTLTPEGSGTRVRLVHSGFEALPNAKVEHESYVQGWAVRPALQGLKKLIEDG
jgi:uncharacterized protein YndB with AHSA1/START domain